MLPGRQWKCEEEIVDCIIRVAGLAMQSWPVQKYTVRVSFSTKEVYYALPK